MAQLIKKIIDLSEQNKTVRFLKHWKCSLGSKKFLSYRRRQKFTGEI